VAQSLLESVRTLVADSDPYMRRLVREMLRNIGVSEIEFAVDGPQALHMLEESKFDLLLAEIDLKGMDGLMVAYKVRRSKLVFDPGLPIIAYCGEVTEQTIARVRLSGINDLMTKPLAAGPILRRVNHLVSTRREFIRLPSYWGPDRRRRVLPGFSGPWRRQADIVAAEARAKEIAEAAALAAAEAEAQAAADALAQAAAEAAALGAVEAAAQASEAAAAAPDPSAMTQEELAKWLSDGKNRRAK